MFTEKEKVLFDAPRVLNGSEQSWRVTVEGDAIVARWNMDATYVAPFAVSNQDKEFTLTFTLNDQGKWKEVDKSEQNTTSVGMSNGTINFSKSKDGFKGKMNQKSFSIGLGKNNQTGETGIVTHKFDTTPIKKLIRTYLTSHGWKKAGLFG